MTTPEDKSQAQCCCLPQLTISQAESKPNAMVSHLMIVPDTRFKFFDTPRLIQEVFQRSAILYHPRSTTEFRARLSKITLTQLLWI
ncbi:MAG: hypothetical protein JWQ71_1214 [Pedosphaera sp.]|nr:hypothetical protein [Pedosphaera sp.]